MVNDPGPRAMVPAIAVAIVRVAYLNVCTSWSFDSPPMQVQKHSGVNQVLGSAGLAL